jgi:hypothetical protein
LTSPMAAIAPAADDFESVPDSMLRTTQLVT